MTSLVSVVLPVYNAEEYISVALQSILNQTYKNLEVVVVNDGSTDNSLDVIRSLADKRVKIISRENRGLVASLNEGIETASGDYIARMDADDISHPERISKQIKLLEENKSVLVCGTSYKKFGFRSETIQNPLLPEKIRRNLCWGPVVCHPSAVFKRSVFFKIEYEKEFFPAEDYKLWYEVFRQGQIMNLPEVLYKYRIHNKQISEAMKSQQVRAHIAVSQLIWKDIYARDLPFEIAKTVIYGGPFINEAVSFINNLESDDKRYALYLLYKNNFNKVGISEKAYTIKNDLMKKMNKNW